MDNLVSIIYALCGLSYTILAGKGKFCCFIFGLLSSVLYAFLSFRNALWGSFLLNFLYYIPLQIISLFKWIQNTDTKTKSIKKVKLSKRILIISFLSALILTVILYYFLKMSGDNQPVLDSIVTIFSILGMYLTMQRALEQWFIWTIVNLATLIIWIIALIQGMKVYATVLLWLIYLILGIIFYFQWKKEISSNQ
ncbi:MAG: nicotinamide mononucleotide transporter [Candidatus Gastranaerophilales bacterium]|nr:nicotinamide mononucleotide transporter [Candidatus Gastranaerophilales bacterium]